MGPRLAFHLLLRHILQQLTHPPEPRSSSWPLLFPVGLLASVEEGRGGGGGGGGLIPEAGDLLMQGLEEAARHEERRNVLEIAIR